MTRASAAAGRGLPGRAAVCRRGPGAGAGGHRQLEITAALWKRSRHLRPSPEWTSTASGEGGFASRLSCP